MPPKGTNRKDQGSLSGVVEYIERELDKLKSELKMELQLASAQIGGLHGELTASHDKSASTIAKEIRFSYLQNQTIYDGLASMLTKEVGERLNSMEEMLTALGKLQLLLDSLEELKYAYMNMQALCETTQALVANEVNPKLDSTGAILSNEVNPKLDAITNYLGGDLNAKIDAISNYLYTEIGGKLDAVQAKQALLDQIQALAVEINDKLVALPTEEDYIRLADSVAAKTEEIAAAHSRKIVDEIAALPTAENVDYSRIVEEVGDKVLDILHQIKGEDPAPVLPVETKIDYDRIICGAAEKVIESLPYPEKVDYSRMKAMLTIDTDALAETVATKIAVPAAPEVDYDRLADIIASKIAVPAAPEVDYDRLADMVIEKMAANSEQTCEVMLDEDGIDEIAAKVAGKIIPAESIDYDKVCQAAQAAQILPDPVDYDRIAEIVENKLGADESTYDLVIDEEGVSALAKGISEEICQMCASCELEGEEVCVAAEETPVEEPVVEEAPVEEIAEEPVVEETVEEPVVEEAPAAVAEELAATQAIYEEVGNDLIDAETGLVIRLKRSFTAKMKQSEEKVKEYYSDLKNELTSYKKINSNVSWHGDRFNFGRDTVAKINICGKTLCFYVALDPNDPEYKTTVYHQKDVGAQKAYENTPFMVKVKSDAAAKKALRLVGYLAEKLGTEKEENFEAVDYAGEFAYASTKQLFDEGLIKATKEKKVDLNF